MQTALTSLRSHARSYYRLTKPGIIYGNLLMYTAGFFLGSWSGINWQAFFIGLIGLSLIIAAACVFNNVADKEIDQKMHRTAKRSIATGEILPLHALIFGEVLFVLGVITLYFFSDPIAFLAAIVGFVVYVYLYTPLKKKSGTALYVGAVAGAMPPVVGYAAAAHTLDLYALALFAALFLWQLPHFLAIGFKRYEEYAAAGVPLHVSRGPKSELEKKIANQIFVGSLVLLLGSCVAIALWRLLLA
jgi:heme o synthase